MKATIHPAYHQATVKCACGNTFTVGSTEERIDVEICSACHPFYTGTHKLVDTAGRVDKFLSRLQKQTELSATKAAKKPRENKQKTEA